MKSDINPYRELPVQISPLEFEQFCMETLKAYAEKEALQNFEIKHNQKIETPDSTYQIDVLAEYTALGCRFMIIVECKKHSRSIERSTVAELYAKVQSIGAQKGILISSSGFQSDAVKYANAHGVALWQICNRFIKHMSASAGPELPQYILFQLEMDHYLPNYYMLEWDCVADFPYNELYPTQEMYDKARRAVKEKQQNRRENNG